MTVEEAIQELEYILVGHPKTSARGQAVLMAIETLKALKQPEQKKARWISNIIGIVCSNYCYKLETTGLLSKCPHCGAKMEICDDVSDFQPTRKDVEKAFDILLDKSKEE